jgi:spermidine/putrescine transport system permease protein
VDNGFLVLARVVSLAVFTLLLAPLAVAIVVSFTGSASLGWPPDLFSTRWYESAIESARVREVAWNSCKIALVTATLSVALALPAAYALVRRRRPASGRALQALLVVPIIVPGLILAVGLVATVFTMGVDLSMRAIVIGHVVVALPFSVLIIAAAALALDPRVEEASYDLGASATRTFFRITVPSLSDGIRAAFLLSFVISFNEVVLASFLGGEDTTLPVFLSSEFVKIITPEVYAIVGLLTAITVVILASEYVFVRRVVRR